MNDILTVGYVLTPEPGIGRNLKRFGVIDTLDTPEGELDADHDGDNEREAHANELTLLVEPLLEFRGHGLHELLELVDLTGQLVHIRRHFRHFGTKAVGGRGSGHGGEEALPLDLSDNAFGEFVLEISHRTLSR